MPRRSGEWMGGQLWWGDSLLHSFDTIAAHDGPLPRSRTLHSIYVRAYIFVYMHVAVLTMMTFSRGALQ